MSENKPSQNHPNYYGKYCTVCTSYVHTASHHVVNTVYCEHCIRFTTRLYKFEDTECCRKCLKIFKREEVFWEKVQGMNSEIQTKTMPWNSSPNPNEGSENEY